MNIMSIHYMRVYHIAVQCLCSVGWRRDESADFAHRQSTIESPNQAVQLDLIGRRQAQYILFKLLVIKSLRNPNGTVRSACSNALRDAHNIEETSSLCIYHASNTQIP